MIKRVGICKWIMMVVVVAIILFAVVGGKMMFENYVSIHGQRLNTYRYSSGGGMDGGYSMKTVKRYGDRALISIESAEWHAQDPNVVEYLVDIAILDELEEVVRKCKMNFWNRKKFTNEFVCDGESESYHFDFDDADISFSSQIYPMKYRNKLSMLKSVIDKYIENGERLPGLVNTKVDKEEHYLVQENKLVIYVYSYVENTLGLKILNGTDVDIEIPETYKIINVDTGVVLSEEKTPYGGNFSEHSQDEMNIKLTERLYEGNYRIIFGEWDIPFEIR